MCSSLNSNLRFKEKLVQRRYHGERDNLHVRRTLTSVDVNTYKFLTADSFVHLLVTAVNRMNVERNEETP